MNTTYTNATQAPDLTEIAAEIAADSVNALVESLERVQHLRTCLSEIARVPRSNGEILLKRSGGDHSVQERERLSFPLQINDQKCPPLADRGIPRNTINSLYHCLKPLFELSPLAPAWKREDTDVQFAENDGIHNEICFVRGQPVDNPAVLDHQYGTTEPG